MTTLPVLRRWAPGVASGTMALAADQPCGDAAAWMPSDDGSGGLLAIVDGLGHGPEAARAADAACAQLLAARQAATDAWDAVVGRVDEALRPLRGAALGLVRLRGGVLSHVGVGNTRAMRWREGRIDRLPSQNGVVGGGMPPTLLETTLDVRSGDWIVMFTDGLDERLGWPVELPEWRRDPALLCLHLMERHRCASDDCGVIVMHVAIA